MKKMHSSKKGKADSFSAFFHSASKRQKTTVFIKAAEKANEDQRDLVKNANLKFKDTRRIMSSCLDKL